MKLESIEKLRGFKYDYDSMSTSLEDAIDDVADEIEAEIDARFMELPVDAEGVPIRVGDVMVDYKTPRNVVAVAPDSFFMSGYEIDSFYRPGLARNHRHYVKPRTVEDVTNDIANEIIGILSSDDGIRITHEQNTAIYAITAKYAAELQMRGDAE